MSEHARNPFGGPRSRVLRGPLAATSAGSAHLGTELAPGGRSLAVLGPETIALASEEGRALGYAEGFATGHAHAVAAGTAAADDQRAALARQVRGAVGALGSAADALLARQSEAVRGSADEVAAVAFALVEQLLGRELELATDPGRDAVARALAATPDGVDAIVRLAPADIAVLADLTDLAPGRGVTVVADPAVEPGGCLLEAGACRIDARLSSGLERVRSSLLGDV